MAKLPPIYKEHGKTYQADTCRPVVQAVEAGQIRLEALARGHYSGRQLKRNALPGVKSVGFWNAKHDQDWGLDWHRNEGIEFTFLETGRLGFAVDDHSCRLEPNDLTITRPWQPHRVGDPNVTAGRLHWLILDVGVHRPHQAWQWPDWLVLTAADRKQLTNVLRHNEQPVWHTGDQLRHCFRRIGKAIETDRDGSNVSRLTVHLNELFVLVLEMFSQDNVRLDESLSSARRTVELFLDDLTGNREHLAQEWTLKSMAGQCDLGTTHFTHHCKQLTNMSPIEYLNHCRLEAAAKLLVEQPQMSVLDIALACGFSSRQYFATLFRRHFGRTPRAFRTRS